jgi:hypothetical protein
MVQCESKERGFKQGFKKGFRSKVLKQGRLGGREWGWGGRGEK